MSSAYVMGGSDLGVGDFLGGAYVMSGSDLGVGDFLGGAYVMSDGDFGVGAHSVGVMHLVGSRWLRDGTWLMGGSDSWASQAQGQESDAEADQDKAGAQRQDAHARDHGFGPGLPRGAVGVVHGGARGPDRRLDLLLFGVFLPARRLFRDHGYRDLGRAGA
ncbi:hypothetical protein ACFC18_54690 [Streptomyces sp. NPDC056121]|uniref:hypothetical protein n=1 Tax=Streptomyces sp. NPDC056121 TaxID=3345718 RepID=UPI0035DCA561